MKSHFGLVILLLFHCYSSSAAEIRFAKERISVGGVRLEVEIADSPDKWSQGLMFRKKLADNSGMLFIFNDTQIRSFWMKNTFIGLSIGYFDSDGVLIDIQNMVPVKSEMEIPESYVSKAPARYALEVNRGWFEKNKIKLGDRLRRSDKGRGL